MWFVPRFGIVGNVAVGSGGMIVVILIMVGLAHALLAMAFAVAAGALAAGAILFVAKLARWPFPLTFKPLWAALYTGFMAFTFVTWLVDLIAHTNFSMPAMVAALDRPVCWPNCLGVPPLTPDGRIVTAINSRREYYDVAVGSGPLAMARYWLLLGPGIFAFALAIASIKDDVFRRKVQVSTSTASAAAQRAVPQLRGFNYSKEDWLFAGREGLPRLVAATAVSIGVGVLVVFPVFVSLMLALRNIDHH